MTAETTLTLRRPLEQRVDASGVSWDALRGLDAKAIEEQELWIEGAGPAHVGDLFQVAATPGKRAWVAKRPVTTRPRKPPSTVPLT